MMDAGPSRSKLILFIMHNSHAIRLERKRWALSQEELANLLSITRPALTRLEIETESTSLETALGLLVVFGTDPSTILPRTYARIEEAVMTRAADLDCSLRGKTDQKSLRKLQLLSNMVRQATARTNRL